MRRRDIITLLGGAAVWPLGARAQQLAMPVIGFLNGQSPGNFVHLVAAFRRGLEETGYSEGPKHRDRVSLGGRSGRAAAPLADDLVRRQVAVIVATGGAHLVAKAGDRHHSDRLHHRRRSGQVGLVASISRPGGNLTGVSVFTTDLEAKRLELLNELLPHAAAFAVLIDPNFVEAALQVREVQSAGRTIGREVHILNATTDAEIEQAFATVRDCAPPEWWWRAIRSSTAGATRSSRWRRVMRYR